MFYLFLLQKNLLTSTELNAIYSDFSDRSAGQAALFPRGAERHPAQFSPLLFLGT